MTLRIEKLTRLHQVENFDCGTQALNLFIQRHAMTSQFSHASQTYLGISDAEIAGYYTLSAGEVAYDVAPDRLRKGLARHPVPVMVLARLAVALTFRQRGFGVGLLKNAMLRTVQAADIAGVRALVVHAKDNAASAFYQHLGFEPSEIDPLHQHMLLKDIIRVLDKV